MKSISLIAPCGLEIRFQDQCFAPVAALGTLDLRMGRDHPAPILASPSSPAKHASESNRGQQSQSIEPSRPTSAAVSQSPISA
jgi:hypothetical protein